MRGLRARFRVEGMRVERLLEMARGQGLPLYKIERRGADAVACECREDDFPAVRALAEERGYKVLPLPPRGLKRAQVALLARPGLLAGVLAFALVVTVAMRFVWRVEIEGAGKYAAETRVFLEERGVTVGALARRLSAAELQSALEWRLPGVAYVRVTLEGAVLRIAMFEGTEGSAPETAGAPGDVVAARDGVLHSLSVLAGTAQKKPGDIVRAGDVLILGQERGAGGEPVAVKARGEALARVWVRTSVRLPAYETLSAPTGRESERFLFITPWRTFASAPEPEYLAYDRELTALPLPGAWLPVQIARETRREVALSYAMRDPEACAREATEAAARRLHEKTAGYQMVDKWTDYSMIDRGFIEATATGEMLVDIARYAPYPSI